MRTARLFTVSCSAQGGSAHPPPPPTLDADPPGVDLPNAAHPDADPLVMWPVMHAGKSIPLWTEWLTDRCKNITLPQTSFVGGN